PRLTAAKAAHSGLRIPPTKRIGALFSSTKTCFGALGGIRTPNNWFEASRDIHFTTRAWYDCAMQLKQNQMPAEVLLVAAKLQKAGFEAWVVGGCVRDLLLNRVPKDWDITTNANPEQIQGLFENTFYTNDFGTVGVVNDATE